MNGAGLCHCASLPVGSPIMRADRFMQLWRLPGEKGCNTSGRSQSHICTYGCAFSCKVLMNGTLITHFSTAQ